MKYIINDDQYVKMRLDQCINLLNNDLTRNAIQKLIEKGNITVNGKTLKSSYKVKANDIINIKEAKLNETKPIAEKIKLDIIYEDDDILIINKRKGVVVHPGNGNYTGTIVNALLFFYKDSLSQINGATRPGIVHRIDKNTSGLLVVAKNDYAHKKLSRDFKEHNITRRYIALVNGIIDKDNLKVNLPLGRDNKDRKKTSVTTQNSKEAITNIKVIERFFNSNYTLIEATLVTGRTHQIRVHMAYLKHSIVGDDVYGKAKNEFNILGQMLHAKVLGINHPKTCKYMEFESKLPNDFEKVLNKLRSKEK